MTLTTVTLGPLSKNPLRLHRHRKGLTQKQLAHATGVSESLICQIERREVIPSLKVAFTLCQVTGITLESLVRFCLSIDDPPSVI